MPPHSGPRRHLTHDERLGIGFLIGIPLGLWVLGAVLPPAPDTVGVVARLILVAGSIVQGLRLLVGALASVALVFVAVPWVFPTQAPTQVAAQGQTAAPDRTTAPTSNAALSTGAPAATPPSAHGSARECAEKLFTTVVLLVVILAFKDLVLGAIDPAAGAATTPVGGPYQVPFALLAIAVTLAAGVALGTAWGAFALGVMVLQTVDVAPHPALTQTLILIATFCNQRSPRADNVLNLLGGKYATGPNVTALWSVTSFALPLPGRRVPVQAEWVQAALVLLGVLVAWGQAVG